MGRRLLDEFYSVLGSRCRSAKIKNVSHRWACVQAFAARGATGRLAGVVDLDGMLGFEG